MPRVLQSPALAGGAFYLRPPELPPSPEEMAPPLLYTEAEVELERAAAARTARETALAEFETVQARLEGETRQAVADLLETARSLHRERQGLLLGAAEGTVELAFAVARRVLRREVECDPGAVLPLVHELLARGNASAALSIRLSPRDHAHLASCKDSLAEAAGLDGLRLRVDAAIAPGGCVVETEQGTLDGRLETQLERIEEALRAVRRPVEDEGSVAAQPATAQPATAESASAVPAAVGPGAARVEAA